MRYIVDGYNVLFKFETSLSFQEKREQFINKVASYMASRDVYCLIVFDAHERAGEEMLESKDSVKIIYTEEGEHADDCIKRLVHSASNPRELIVVTSDNAIKRSVRETAAQTMPATAFLKLISKKKIKEKEKQIPDVSNDEMAWWLEVFSRDL